MTTTAEQIRKPLPESLMNAIGAVCRSEMQPAEQLEAVLLITTGYGLVEQAETIDPTRFAIPEEQWTRISALLMDVDRGSVERVNLSLSWMNSGPSAYTEGER